MRVSTVVFLVLTGLGSNFLFSNGQIQTTPTQNPGIKITTTTAVPAETSDECSKNNDLTPEALKCKILEISAAKTEKLGQHRLAADRIFYSAYDLPENVTSDPFEKFEQFKQKFKQIKEIGDKSEKDKFISFEEMFSTVDSFVKQVRTKAMSNETMAKYGSVLETVVNEILHGIPQGGNALTTGQKLIREMYHLIGITASTNCLL
ncbi:uncharacterized protein LOC135849997 [Planococcus citri]|uniref:uncharacterized protein LOC135849997 n=1 Tax=Planococcus citri TaxID=170843 RepID=UPI0031F7E25C